MKKTETVMLIGCLSHELLFACGILKSFILLQHRYAKNACVVTNECHDKTALASVLVMHPSWKNLFEQKRQQANRASIPCTTELTRHWKFTLEIYPY